MPQPVAVRAHNLFLETNIGDPGLFQGRPILEQALVSRIGNVFPEPDAYGYSSSGGAQPNIQLTG